MPSELTITIARERVSRQRIKHWMGKTRYEDGYEAAQECAKKGCDEPVTYPVSGLFAYLCSEHRRKALIKGPRWQGRRRNVNVKSSKSSKQLL